MSDSYNPTDCSLPGSSLHGISQARILEWVAISFSKEFSWPWNQTLVSCIAGGFFTDWTTRELETPRNGSSWGRQWKESFYLASVTKNWAVSAQQQKWWIRKLLLPCDLSVISGCINFRNFSPVLSDISNIIYYISVLSKPGICCCFFKLPNSEIK